MSLHRIRLAGPWEWHAFTEAEAGPGVLDAPRCQLPFSPEQNAAARGGMLRRRFHCPTGITANTRLVIVVETLGCIPEVWLNDQNLSSIGPHPPNEGLSIGTPAPWRFNASGFLKPFNELTVRLIPSGSDSLPTLHMAALEICEPT